MSIELERVDIPAAGFAEAYLAGNPASLVYATPRFLSLLEAHLDARGTYLVARRDGRLAGILPYMRLDGPLGPVLNSLPYYGSNGGVIQDRPDEEAKLALVNAFYEQARELGSASATIITNPLEGDAAFYDQHARADYRDERIGQVTHLPISPDPDRLLDSFSDPRPRNIRRAIKAGVSVQRRNDAQALDFLYQTHLQNMQAIGGRAKREDFFTAIPARMQDGDWAVYVALLDGTPVAALLLFYFNQTVEYFTPVVVEAHRSTQALSLLVFEAMRDAIGTGYRNWNWGGTWLTQSGVYDFKKRWGTTDYPYFYYTQLYDRRTLGLTPAELLAAYPGFFVIPFSSLEASN